MTARPGRRAVLPILLATTVLVAGCTDGGEERTSPDPAGASSQEASPEALAFGDHPMAQPCALLTPDEVERVIGGVDGGTTWTQDYLDHSLTQAEVEEETDNLSRAVHLRCSYDLGDSTTVELEVDAYRSATDARARFQHDRYLLSPRYDAKMRRLAADPETAWVVDFAKDANELGGEPVPGEPDMLYVPGFARFERLQDNLVLTFTYQEGITFDPEPLSAKDYRRQLPWATELLASAADAVGEASTVPVATVPPDATGAGPDAPFVEPCEILDPEVFEALTGQPEDQEVGSDSLPLEPATALRSSWSKTVHQQCTRRSYPDRGRDANATLEIWTAADPAIGIRTLDKVFAVTYYDKSVWSDVTAGRMQAAGILRGLLVDTGADVDYLFTHRTEGEKEKDRLELLFLVVGPYVVKVSAAHDIDHYVSEDAYTEAATMIVERLRTAAGDADLDPTA
ncbi:hypothetical protein GCM10009623_38790 [Nocardioides aestuarii]|uniref:Peptidase A2 domain-containing protein n=1 Tax=Nocardioides aestuarii TaxID=252231 RepID=A0ABW4TQ69_9ACTN